MCFSGLGGMGSKASIILLLMKETIEFAMRKTNELINYKNSRSSENKAEITITLPSMIKWTAIHLTSMQCSLSPETVIELY